LTFLRCKTCHWFIKGYLLTYLLIKPFTTILLTERNKETYIRLKILLVPFTILEDAPHL